MTSVFLSLSQTTKQIVLHKITLNTLFLKAPALMFTKLDESIRRIISGIVFMLFISPKKVRDQQSVTCLGCRSLDAVILRHGVFKPEPSFPSPFFPLPSPM